MQHEYRVMIGSLKEEYMSALPHMKTYFEDFLSNIRLSEEQRKELETAHKDLRSQLENDPNIETYVIGTWLQGSYRRATIIRPINDNLPDVDVIVITNLDENIYTPSRALGVFKGFLDKYYPGHYKQQGRSWGIELKNAEIDLVPAARPSKAIVEADFLKIDQFTSCDIVKSPILADPFGRLKIPDRESKVWEDADPFGQCNWTITKNNNTDGHYVNVVKAIKWWWQIKYPGRDHPDGYPLERLIGVCCPDNIASVAEGIILSLENIRAKGYTKPVLNDCHIDNDVLARVTEDDYNYFYNAVCEAADIARQAFESPDEYSASSKWQELFGDAFPLAPDETKRVTFTEGINKGTKLNEARFA